MATTTPIRIVDHAERFIRLAVLGDCGDKFYDAFDDTCQRLFGATNDLLTDDEWEGCLDQFPYFTEAQDYCVERGFDLSGEVGPIRYWQMFAAMVVARERGLFNLTADEIMERRLAAEARDFQDSQVQGVIKGS